MRENMGIYRGKRLDGNGWVFGSLINFDNETTFIFDDPAKGRASTMSYRQLVVTGMHAVDPDTIGQFTNCTDKNGAMVVEGDVLLVICKGYVEKALVVWEHGGWRALGERFFDNVPLADFLSCEIDVITNIHDTPLKEATHNG